MTLFAGAVFAISLLGIVLLFWIKIRERERGNVLALAARQLADLHALRLKELLAAAQIDLKKVPPLLVFAGHRLVHASALTFAYAARAASRRAHALADFVSHKRNFQRRETRSEFLNKLSELKSTPEEGDGQPTQERIEF